MCVNVTAYSPFSVFSVFSKKNHENRDENNAHKTYYIIYNKLSLHYISTFIDVHQASLPLKTENVEYALSCPSAGHVRGLAYAKSWFVFARQNFAFASKNNAPNTWQRVSEVVSLHCQSVDSYPSAGNPQTINRNAARRVLLKHNIF